MTSKHPPVRCSTASFFFFLYDLLVHIISYAVWGLEYHGSRRESWY